MTARTLVAALSAALAVGACALSSCGSSAPLPDLTRDLSGLGQAEVAGRGSQWIQDQIGREIRLNDDVWRTLPASPPSRLAFTLDVPQGARLQLACGISPAYHQRPGIEFVVKVRHHGREQRAWSLIVDPLREARHRRWVEADIDLAAYAGRGVVVTLETLGYEETGASDVAYWGAPALTVARRAPLVVLYLVDTLRADHTSVYGYSRDTTPRLARLAQDGIVFEQAIAQASWTKPSVATILTALPPHRHGVVQLRDALDVKHVTLAERLGVQGYAAGAAVSNVVIYGKDTHFEQGFDHFVGLHGPNDRPTKTVLAATVIEAALAWIDARRGHPQFLYVHTMDPHVPYTPPAPFNRRYPLHPKPGHPGVDPRTDALEPQDRERLVAQYDGEIAYGDQELGRFLDGLKERGLYDEALIVFVSDHGEEFLDHGQWLHGRSVFDELVRVPLIVKLPRGAHAGRRVTQQVRTLDILPTILAALGLPAPDASQSEGRPLQPVIAGTAPPLLALSEISHRGNVAFGVRTEREKYVRRFSPEQDPFFGDVDTLLFDLAADAQERRNTLAAHAQRAAELARAIEPALVPPPYRTLLRLAGSGRYDLTLRTRGWLEAPEATGLGPGESIERISPGELHIRVTPTAKTPREVRLTVRPVGTLAWLAGARDGRPLKPEDVSYARAGAHPPAVPCRLPEADQEQEDGPSIDTFAAPEGDRAGLSLWLVATSGQTAAPLDKATCEQLRELGYMSSCDGL